MKIEQKPRFGRIYKKLRAAQRREVDKAIRVIVADPEIGEAKRGDLSGVRVFKFKMIRQLTLLAYNHADETATLTLLALGTHENFYRDLKRIS